MLTGKTEKKTRPTNKRNYTNFGSNLTMMVVYLPVKFEFNWTRRFRVRFGNKNVDGKTTGQNWTNKQTELHQFRKQPIYDGDLSPCQV